MKDMNIKDYHKRDPLSFAEGAFKGLTTMLPKGVSVVRQGGTFAVSSAFPWLVFGRAIRDTPYNKGCYVDKSDWLASIYSNAKTKFDNSPSKTTLYLPHPSAAGVSTINASAGVGGGVHETGHVICDRANGQFPSFKEFKKLIGKSLKMTIPYNKCGLPKWVNVTADMRLEPGMALIYPETEHRFFSIQKWVHELEAEVRGKKTPSDFLMALRDAGKGWVNEESKEVYSQYGQEARDLVEMLKPIWSELKPTNSNWESSAHLPISVAVEVINALHKLLEEPEKKGKKGKGKPQEGGGEPQEGEGEPQEGEDEPQEGKGDPQEGSEAGKSPMSLEDIERLLEGEGEALDPSSAMRKEVRANAKKLDHVLYIPNGVKPIYKKLL
jgi:hypothetical protein